MPFLKCKGGGAYHRVMSNRIGRMTHTALPRTSWRCCPPWSSSWWPGKYSSSLPQRTRGYHPSPQCNHGTRAASCRTKTRPRSNHRPAAASGPTAPSVRQRDCRDCSVSHWWVPGQGGAFTSRTGATRTDDVPDKVCRAGGHCCPWSGAPSSQASLQCPRW